jgi:O-methyltransferase
VPEAPISDLTSESWPYRADLPQRYSDQYKHYLARGGLVQLPEDVTPFVNGGHGRDMGRFYFFCLVLDQLQKERLIEDVAELGVYKGHTAALLSSIARRLGTAAYLLDTFAGIHADDLTGIDANKIPEFADTSLDAVRALVGEDNVRYVKGRFPGSASQMPEDARFSLVHIDCDLYEPVSAGLQYFYPDLFPVAS